MELFYSTQENKRLNIFLSSNKCAYLSCEVYIWVYCALPTNMNILNASQDICSEHDKSPKNRKFHSVNYIEGYKHFYKLPRYEQYTSFHLRIKNKTKKKINTELPCSRKNEASAQIQKCCVCVREIDFTEFHLSTLIMFLVLLFDLTINERPPSPL